jgi:predicted pyridoxine 5'-phosphate oxidase superfamily flavin-nucleotide-binding protein
LVALTSNVPILTLSISYLPSETYQC